MGELFRTIVLEPIINALIFFHSIVPGGDIGIAIVLVTIVIRFILFPLSRKATRAQKEMALIQPQIKKIQKEYKDNREEQTKLLMELYKKHKINPFAGIVPILIQLPILIALYRVLLDVFNGEAVKGLYPFITAPETINVTFLGLMDLSEKNPFLAIAVGVAQFFHSKLIMGLQQTDKKSKSLKELAAEGKKPDAGDMSKAMGKQMMYIMPAIMMLFSFTLPAGLPLYFLVTTIFSIAEFYLVKSKDIKEIQDVSKKAEEDLVN